MTKAKGELVPADSAEGFLRDWQSLRADDDIQFAPVQIPEPTPPPAWLQDLAEYLGNLFSPVGDAITAIAQAIGVSGQVLMWTLVAIGVLLLLYLLFRLVGPSFSRRRKVEQAVEEWAPDAGEALALLDEADRLAAEGRFDEATHLLLKRSVGQIAAARPSWLEPSSTAREIAELPDLSQSARGAFTTIAERVERSLFALRRLGADDWQAARAAYAEFALAGPQAGLA